MRHFAPTIPVILVGCKMDLRANTKTLEELKRIQQTPVTVKQVSYIILLAYMVTSLKILQGEAMAEKIGAVCYVECSALRGDGVREVFRTATTCALGTMLRERELKGRQSSCIIA